MVDASEHNEPPPENNSEINSAMVKISMMRSIGKLRKLEEYFDKKKQSPVWWKGFQGFVDELYNIYFARAEGEGAITKFAKKYNEDRSKYHEYKNGVPGFLEFARNEIVKFRELCPPRDQEDPVAEMRGEFLDCFYAMGFHVQGIDAGRDEPVKKPGKKTR